MRVVLDTGILIAALITADTPPDQVYQAWRKKRFTLIASAWQIGEFRRASRYERVKKFLKPSRPANSSTASSGTRRCGRNSRRWTPPATRRTIR